MRSEMVNLHTKVKRSILRHLTDQLQSNWPATLLIEENKDFVAFAQKNCGTEGQKKEKNLNMQSSILA